MNRRVRIRRSRWARHWIVQRQSPAKPSGYAVMAVVGTHAKAVQYLKDRGVW